MNSCKNNRFYSHYDPSKNDLLFFNSSIYIFDIFVDLGKDAKLLFWL